MQEEKTYYRRNLPHYQPEYATYFVTFRLAGSLPADVISRLKSEHEVEEKQLLQRSTNAERRERLYESSKRYFGKFDHALDHSGTGPHWLKNPAIAEMVAEAIHHRNGKVYNLFAFCIMSNHVHMVFSVGRRSSAPYIVTKILENLKWYTALKANQLLNRKGQFWQHESYDHVVRKDGELERIIRYVLGNPVKAGLVAKWSQWRWTYVSPELIGDNK